MKADWFRSWHGAPTDGKWRMVAADVGCKPAEVAAMVWALLDFASAHEHRGSIAGFNLRVYAMDSGTLLDTVIAIRSALHDPSLHVLSADNFLNWNKRQPKREDSTSADRQRAVRERAKAASDDAVSTGRHAPSRTVTPGHDLEEKEEERKEIDRKAVDARLKRATRLSDDFSVSQKWREWATSTFRWTAVDADEEAATFVDYWRSKPGKDGTKLDWEATWRNWCRNSNRRPGRDGARASPATNGLGMAVPC